MSSPITPALNIRDLGVVIPHDRALLSHRPGESIWQNRKVTVGIPVAAMLVGGVALAVGLTVLSGGTAGLVLAIGGGTLIGLGGAGGTVGLAKYTPLSFSQKQIDNVTKDVTNPEVFNLADVELDPVTDPELDPLKPKPLDKGGDEIVLGGSKVDPTLAPEAAPNHVKKDDIELPVESQADLAPSSNPPFSSPVPVNPLVERAFQELTGQPFNPIYTQRNSYTAYELLEQVANKDRTRLEQSLEHFKLKHPVTYPTLIEKAVEFAERAPITDQGIIALLKAERSFAPPSYIKPPVINNTNSNTVLRCSKCSPSTNLSQ